MGKPRIRIQVIILFLLILVNFIAQIPYYLHFYYNPNNLLPSAKEILLMLLILGLFLFASILLFTRKVLGYWLMVIFLTGKGDASGSSGSSIRPARWLDS